MASASPIAAGSTAEQSHKHQLHGQTAASRRHSSLSPGTAMPAACFRASPGSLCVSPSPGSGRGSAASAQSPAGSPAAQLPVASQQHQGQAHAQVQGQSRERRRAVEEVTMLLPDCDGVMSGMVEIPVAQPRHGLQSAWSIPGALGLGRVAGASPGGSRGEDTAGDAAPSPPHQSSNKRGRTKGGLWGALRDVLRSHASNGGGSGVSSGPQVVRAHLTAEGFSLGPSLMLLLEDIVAVSCCEGDRMLTVHAYPRVDIMGTPLSATGPMHLGASLAGGPMSGSGSMRAREMCCVVGPIALGPCGKRKRLDIDLLVPSPEAAWRWGGAFAALGCFVHLHHLSSAPGTAPALSPLPHPASLPHRGPHPHRSDSGHGAEDCVDDQGLGTVGPTRRGFARLGGSDRERERAWGEEGSGKDLDATWHHQSAQAEPGSLSREPGAAPRCATASDAPGAGPVGQPGAFSSRADSVAPGAPGDVTLVHSTKLHGENGEALAPIRMRKAPVMAIVVNPKSGHGRAAAYLHRVVLPILQLAGFKLTVLETQHARHAVELAATMDIGICRDGIVCIGGDGIVNEVLNGLVQRSAATGVPMASLPPVGIIPAGSDNSVAWSVLQVRDPASAALAIVKGLTVSVDVLRMQWGWGATPHVGLCTCYFGFMSDVLELSSKYQPYFGPLRYAVAGVTRFVSLPSFEYDIDFLPCTHFYAPTTTGAAAGSADATHAGPIALSPGAGTGAGAGGGAGLGGGVGGGASAAGGAGGGLSSSCSSPPSMHSVASTGTPPSAFFPTSHGGGSDAGSIESDGRAGAGGGARTGVGFGNGNGDTDKYAPKGIDTKDHGEGDEFGAFCSEAVKYDLSRRLGASKGGTGSGLGGSLRASLPESLPGIEALVMAMSGRFSRFRAKWGQEEGGDEEGGGGESGTGKAHGGKESPPPAFHSRTPHSLIGMDDLPPLERHLSGRKGRAREEWETAFWSDGAGSGLGGSYASPSHHRGRARVKSRVGGWLPLRDRERSGAAGATGGVWQGEGADSSPQGRSPWRQRKAVGDRKGSNQVPQAHGEGGGLFYQGQGQSSANLRGTVGAPGNGEGQEQAQARVGLTRSLSDEDFSARKWLHQDLVGGSPGVDAAGAPQDPQRGSLGATGTVTEVAGRRGTTPIFRAGSDTLGCARGEPVRQGGSSSAAGVVSGAEVQGGTGQGTGTGPEWGRQGQEQGSGPAPGQEQGQEEAEPGPRWVRRRGRFLCVIVCNHLCRSVQCLDSQSLAPLAGHNDGCLDLLLVNPVSAPNLIRFLVLMQIGAHIDLPFVEYYKVKALRVRLGPGNQHKACGIDGELMPFEGMGMADVLPSACRLVGRAPGV